MQSSNKKLPQTTEFNTQGFKNSAEICLSLVTGPFLVGLVGVQMLAECLHNTGISSEEVFRGDRLPTLHFPKSQPSDTP
ncbi:MAG: hypothetical protein KME08_08820 [Aphanothece sp. CMT-3BRIN-NPC111]|jgi:hypothetical protein|nr:hypothetical protein [Aphanothece sp. CMT-3BRIN-NPC111]